MPTKSGDIIVPSYVFNDHHLSNNLAGLSTFCNQGCTATLTAETIDITKGGESVWQGFKANTDRLWNLDLDDIRQRNTQAHVDNNPNFSIDMASAFQTIRLDTDAERVRFAHEVFGSCPLPTFLHAMDMGWLGNFPGLTAKQIRQNPDISRACAMGYLDQTRQKQNSTKQRLKRKLEARAMHDRDPSHTTDTHADSNLCFQVVTREEFFNSSDATGRFPVPTASGYEYILVSTLNGYVHLELLKARTAQEYLRAYKSMYAFYEAQGKLPTRQRLDNETSGHLEAFLREVNTKIEYVAPGIHRQNPSERAIRHAKNCIIAMCITADSKFPANMLFEAVVVQAEIVLNQLRPWHPDPTINAWTGMHNAPYDHMAHPLSVFGMLCVAHVKPHQRTTFAEHGKDGFYMGPALHHYRCWRIYISATKAERITDTVAWFPVPYHMPGHSPLEALTAATTDLVSAINDMTVSEQVLVNSIDNAGSGAELYKAVKRLQELYAQPVTERPSISPLPYSDVPPGFESLLPTAPDVLPDAQQRVHTDGDQPAAGSPHLSPATLPAVPTPVPSPRVAPVVSTPPAPPTPISYRWTRVERRDVKGAPLKHFQHIGRLFIDDEGTYRIIAIDRNGLRARGAGRHTLFYKYYNINEHMAPPSNEEDYERTPCAELKKDKSTTWTTETAAGTALMASVLNLSDDGSPLTTQAAMTGKHSAEWALEGDKEFRKLYTETETIKPIHRHQIPEERRKDIAYYNPQVQEKIKEQQHVRRVRGTIGGDRVNYPGATAARTASLEVVRSLLNSTLCDDAEWSTADITDYYLNTPLLRPEYMRMTRKQISPTIMVEYDLEQYFDGDTMHFEINKGMYGLPQAGLLAQNRLIAHLATAGYIQSTLVPCLFKHIDNGVTFVLVVDDFGIKARNEAGRQHLLATLRQMYKITVDATGSQYLGMTIVHDHKAKTITISMPGYIDKALTRFHLWAGNKHAYSPGIYKTPEYGQRVQYATEDTSPPLSKAEAKTLQEVVGSLLYYARAVDPTMLTATTTIASEQSKPTEAVKAQAVRLLQYAAAHRNHVITFKKSKMHVIIQTDASYLSRSKARSVAGVIIYFGDAANPTVENGMVHAMSSIIDVVVASAGEAEYGAAFIAAQQGVWIRNIAVAMGHVQPSTPLLCDNEFAIGLGNDTIKQRKSKSIDMRFHWLRDRIRQGQFTLTYLAGKYNLADFFTKTLPVAVHQLMTPRLVS